LNADGSFTYVHDGSETTTDSFTYKANDGSADSAPVTVNLTVTAVNDAPDIRIGSGDTGSVTLTETNAPLSAGGTLTVTDVDTPDTISVSNVALYNATGSQGTITDQQLLAMFTVAPMSGVAANVGDSGNLAWSFNSTPEAFNYLNAGQSLTLEFAVEVSDGHGGQDTQHVSVIINGTADAPVIGGVDIGSVTEDDAAHTIASGALTISDPDAGQSSFVAQSATGTYGSFAIDASGNWSYTLNNADPDTAALNTGQNPIETFTVHSADGTAHDVKVTVNGHTDVTVITLPSTFTGTGDPNDFDNLGGAPAGSAVNFTGGGGTDVVDGSNSVDTLNGGGGDDTLYGHGGDDNINGGNGADTHLYGQAGNDLIYGANGSDTIYGGSGNDTIYGNEPPPPNETGDTGDTIFGGSGGDFIYGQGGNDVICGGYGADILSGGGGSDSFVYLDVKDTNDTITDFALGDTINLNALDADGVLSGNQNFAFGGTTATAHGVWYAQVGGDTLVYVDTDGNSSTAELAITLTGSHALTSSDFIL
jgi:VCBS repeat-containing protein